MLPLSFCLPKLYSWLIKFKAFGLFNTSKCEIAAIYNERANSKSYFSIFNFKNYCRFNLP